MGSSMAAMSMLAFARMQLDGYREVVAMLEREAGVPASVPQAAPVVEPAPTLAQPELQPVAEAPAPLALSNPTPVAPKRVRETKPAGLRPAVVHRHMDAVLENITDEPQTGRDLIKLTGLSGPEFRAAAAELRRRGVITNDGANWSRAVANTTKATEDEP